MFLDARKIPLPVQGDRVGWTLHHDDAVIVSDVIN
jgi:hypothetical protein